MANNRPGATMTHAEKLEIAAAARRDGRRHHRGRFSHRLRRRFRAVNEIAQAVRKRPVICGLARAQIRDIDRCWEAVKHAASPAHPHLHRHLAAAPRHPEPDQGRDGRADPETVTHARNLCDNVQWSPMDATRTEWDYLKRVCRDRDQGGRDHDQHPRHRGLYRPARKRRPDPQADREGAGRATR